MSGAVIVAARRSAVVPRGGAFAHLSLHELARPVIDAVLTEAGITAAEVDELFAANALGGGGNPARVIALACGLRQEVGGFSLDRQCTGGLDAIMLAEAWIRTGQAEIVLAGGVESYSRRPLRMETFADGRAAQAYDQPPFTPWRARERSMAAAAQDLAEELGLSRAAQDEWAISSHARAMAHAQAHRREIVPIAGVAEDPFTRRLTPALCRRATPVCGDITAANMAVAADAAAFCLIVSPRVAQARSLKGVAIGAGAALGGDPDRPGLAPVAAIAAALSKAGLSAQAMSSVEIMEAFAVQALACQRGAGFSTEQTNPAGGALAQGHPIGASGAILAVRLFHRLQGASGHGLAAIAAAGGLGSALILHG